jgi:hypothetical protein
MKELCQFLARGPSGDLRCTAGVNFVSVGSDRARCRVCELQDLADAPLCPNAEVYTFFQRNAAGALGVVARVYCALPADAPPEGRCQTCPERVGTVGLAVKVTA